MEIQIKTLLMNTRLVKEFKQFSIVALLFGSLFSFAAETQEILHFDRFYIAGSPSEKTLADFKKKTGAAIIDLRAAKDMGNCSEPAAASKLGLQYRKVTFEKADAINPDVIRDVDKAVSEAGNKPVLLFCKTGNRAAAWLAIHLVQKEKYSLDDALKVARDLGLKEDGERGVRQYFKTSGKQTGAS